MSAPLLMMEAISAVCRHTALREPRLFVRRPGELAEWMLPLGTSLCVAGVLAEVDPQLPSGVAEVRDARTGEVLERVQGCPLPAEDKPWWWGQ